MGRLFDELKRRNVIRVGIAYLVAAWLILQITDVLVPILTLPESAARFVVLLLVIGFVPALIFAWAYELTPEGVKREREVDRTQSITGVTGRKLDFAIIAMLVLAVIYLVVDNYVFEDVALPTADKALEKSIAVLPFRNRSDNAADVHFIDGIHDDILTKLAKLATLDKVISRTSMERYRDTERPIPQIGEELGVATILEGGVQRAGSRVRINVQLIDASTDEHLWAETYDHELTVENLFAIQNEISREIVTALHGVLSDEEAERLQRMPTMSLEAHAEYAFGRKEMAKRTGEAVLKALAHFENAVELDPDYALAWVGLSDAHVLRIQYLGDAVESTVAAREPAINKALAIDPLSGEAYASLASVRFSQHRFEEAEELFLKAITLSPNYATVYHWYTTVLVQTGRLEEAEAQIRKALELDPMAPVLSENLIAILTAVGRNDEAEAAILESLRRNPEFPGFYRNMADLYKTKGSIAESLRWRQAAVRLNPTAVHHRAEVCMLYLRLGDDESVERCVDKFEVDFPDQPPWPRAVLLVSRGQHDEAAALLEALLAEGVSPFYKPGFAEILFAAGKLDSARALIEELSPELFGDETWAPKSEQDLTLAVLAGSILYADGELERANYLFDQALAAMESMPRTGAGYRDHDVLIYVTRGDKRRATEALREAFEAGVVENALAYKSSAMALMLDEPEWLSLIAELKAEMARQREWYEAHKDDPLF